MLGIRKPIIIWNAENDPYSFKLNDLDYPDILLGRK